jgi:translation elongation factor P/translation initiation factor 5A
MKKQAKDLKKQDKILIADQQCIVQNIELSDIGKQGKRKCRIVVKTPKNEDLIVIRPEDFPIDTA